jgi:hypothetical protein
MNSLRGSLVTAMAAGALLVLPMSNTRVTRIVSRATSESSQDQKTLYSPQQKEFWLSADEFGYIRPGLHITVNSVSIGADGKAVVDLNYTDDLGQPLDRHGAITAGAISTSFILAWYDPNARQYTAYTTRRQTSPITGATAVQAGTDSGGTFTDLDLGHAQYKFGTAVPAGYDATATTTLGIYATRDLITPGVADKNYYDNVEQDFVPNGARVPGVGHHRHQLLQQVPQPAVGARRRAAGRQALRPLPLAPDGRPRHGQHRRLQGDGPQDPPG